MITLQEIMTKYKSDLLSLNANKKIPFEVIINSDWDMIDDNLKIIYCGDNPGKTEKEQKKYFVGNAGNDLNIFVEANNKRLNIESNQYAFFNKTPFHSSKTSDITKQSDYDHSVYRSIELTIECLFSIWEIKSIPIIIFGVNEQTYIVKSFKHVILNDKKYSEFSKSLTVLNHPSHNSLFAEFGRFVIMTFNNKDKFEIKYDDLIIGVKKNWV